MRTLANATSYAAVILSTHELSHIGGGLPITQNRTNWPIRGGAIAFQPGWFHGHKNALIYINLGFASVPETYSEVLVPRFEIRGPTDNPYDGSICLPHVPLPEGAEVKIGDHATIQIVEAATHGAAMYSVCFFIQHAGSDMDGIGRGV